MAFKARDAKTLEADVEQILDGFRPKPASISTHPLGDSSLYLQTYDPPDFATECTSLTAVLG